MITTRGFCKVALGGVAVVVAWFGAAPVAAQGMENWPEHMELLAGYNATHDLEGDMVYSMRLGGRLRESLSTEIEFAFMETMTEAAFTAFGDPFVVPFGISTSERILPMGPSDIERWFVGGSVVKSYRPKSRLSFFVLGGGGYGSTRTATPRIYLDMRYECFLDNVHPSCGDSVADSGETWHIGSYELRWDSRNDLSLHAGAGAKLLLPWRLHLRTEARIRGVTSGDFRKGVEAFMGLGLGFTPREK